MLARLFAFVMTVITGVLLVVTLDNRGNSVLPLIVSFILFLLAVAGVVIDNGSRRRYEAELRQYEMQKALYDMQARFFQQAIQIMQASLALQQRQARAASDADRSANQP